MKYNVTVRFKLNGEYSHSENYNVEIPENTKEDDLMDNLMDATREILQEEFERDEDWEDGNYNWEIFDWDKTN